MLIAQLSDTHISLPNGKRDVDCEKIFALEKCVDAINHLDVIPNVVVHTGDIAHDGSREEYCLAKSILDNLKPPYYLTGGNRDRIKALKSVFGANITGKNNDSFINFSIELNNIKIIAYNSKNK